MKQILRNSFFLISIVLLLSMSTHFDLGGKLSASTDLQSDWEGGYAIAARDTDSTQSGPWILMRESQEDEQDSNVKEAGSPPPDKTEVLEAIPVPLNLREVKMRIGYPVEAQREKIQGRVTVRILVDENGDALRYIILFDPHETLTSAVSAHIMELKFSPGIMKGEPIKCWVTIPFKFELK